MNVNTAEFFRAPLLLLLCLAAAFVSAPRASARAARPTQQSSSSLSGKVSVPARSSAAKLSVKLYFPKTAQRAPMLTYTDAFGNYRFDNLPAGTYLLELTSGAEILYQSEVRVNVGAQRHDISLTQSGNVITVQYFPKEFDRAQIEGALTRLQGRFKVVRGQTELGDTPTNAIFYGSNVGAEEVKTVARALLDAGIKVKLIKKFKLSTGSKANTIQVGSDRSGIRAQGWDHNRLNQATSFDR